MENETEKTPQPEPEVPVRVRKSPRPSNFFGEWAGTLGTVFLCGATLSTLLRWFAEGTSWDMGGTIFSGILAWLCYRLTISDKAISNISSRAQVAVGLAVFWALFFPIVLWAMGFK